MKTFQLSDVDRPQIILECGSNIIETEIMKNVKQNPNFIKPNLYIDVVIIHKFKIKKLIIQLFKYIILIRCYLKKKYICLQ